MPFLIFYGEVSADSDGPVELCRPVASGVEPDGTGGLQLRIEPAHEEAYIRLAMKEMGWPAMLPACDALEGWTADQQRRPAGALRQLLIADQRTAAPDTPVCDLSAACSPIRGELREDWAGQRRVRRAGRPGGGAEAAPPGWRCGPRALR